MRPLLEIAVTDRLPRRAGERQQEMYIVQGEEAQSEYLVRHEKVPDVGAAESRTRRAIAVGIEWARVGAVLGALDVEAAIAGEDRAVASHPGWRDAVEEIDAAADSFDEIFGKSNPHQVARMGLRQRVVNDVEHLVHRVLLLAHRQAADAEARPVVHVADLGGGFAAQVGVDAALDDREERLSGEGGGGRREAVEPADLEQTTAQPADA